MTLTFPYSLGFFNDKLPIASVVWDIKRTSRVSGQGSGRYWEAGLAPPLWKATVELARGPSADMKGHAARIRALGGTRQGFFLLDPLSVFPASDPKGQILGTSPARVDAVPGHMTALSFKELPPGYQLTAGDKFTVNFGANPTRYGFFEVTEDATANSQGTTAYVGVYPTVPIGIVANAIVRFSRPYCLMVIEPDSHNPGRARRHLTEGAGFVAVQRLFA